MIPVTGRDSESSLYSQDVSESTRSQDHRGGSGLSAGAASAFLWSFAILLFYTPSAQLPQLRVVATVALAGLLFILAPGRISRRAVSLILIAVATSAAILLSVVANMGSRQTLAHALMAAFKPIYFALTFAFGYVCIAQSALAENASAVRRTLTRIAITFIVTQFLVSVLQAAGMTGMLDNVYEQGKTRDLETLMRATGTMGNPNSLAFFTLQCFLFILLVGCASWLWRSMALVLGAALIFLSGSRSVALVLLMCLVVFVFMKRKSVATWMAYAVIVAAGTIAVILIVQTYAEYFRYLGQLQLLLTDTNEPLQKISSMAARFNHWDGAIRLFVEYDGIRKWLVGLGDRSEYSVLDNDYLYVALRYGALGVVLFYAFYMELFAKYFSKAVDPDARFFGLTFGMAVIVLSLVGEFFADWNRMSLFILITACLSASVSPFALLNARR